MATIAPLRRQHELGRNHELAPSLPAASQETVKLLDLRAVSQKVRASQEIISEGRRCPAVFLFLDGAAIRYRMLRDGQRQILNVVLPGDFAGVQSCRFEKALYSVRTLTPAVVAPIPVQQLIDLFDSHPRLAARLFWGFSCESTMLAERLVTVGRRPARARVAHFLLELLARLQALGLADDRSYRLPLTQEMIGDALGLSIPYLNRVLHDLRDDGLVHIRDQWVCIDDLEELIAIADFEHTYLRPEVIAASSRRAGHANSTRSSA
jgi:CRP-like cAMP-binding protein